MDEVNLLDSPLGGRKAKDTVSNILSRADLACCELPVSVFSIRSAEQLPHLYPADDIERLFPRYDAPEDDEFISGGADLEDRQAEYAKKSFGCANVKYEASPLYGVRDAQNVCSIVSGVERQNVQSSKSSTRFETRSELLISACRN